MRILYVLDVFPVAGGAETVTRTLANELAARGHEVHVASFRACRDIEVFVDPRVREHVLPVASPKLCRANTEALRALLRERRIDVIVSQSLPPLDVNALCHRARRGTSARLVQCYHGALLQRLKYKASRPLARHVPDFLYRPWKTWREMRILNRAYDRSDRLVLLSPRYAAQYAEICPRRDLGRLRAIHNPVPPPEPIDPAAKEPRLLFVGRIAESHKRLELLARAWEMLCGAEGNRSWSLVVVGDGPDMAALRERVSGLPRVSLEGFRPPEPYYRAGAVFLMTSAFEGLPMTLIEAQQNGCVPVVMDSFLSVRDIVEDGVDGRVVPDGDVEAFAAAVQEILDDPDRRRDMSRAATASSRKFDTPPIADAWEALFAEVVAEP